MQVDPSKPTLKAPGTKRLKLRDDDPLSCFGFNFILRRYTKVPVVHGMDEAEMVLRMGSLASADQLSSARAAVSRMSELLGEAVQVDPIKTMFKAPGTKALDTEL